MSKMKLFFKEHYYTASKYKGGFFTLDCTEGLKEDEIKELEKKGEYNPPVKLPTDPTEEEMESLFPVNLSFFRLKSSGKYVFLHSKYIGKANDSVSRHGNFFTHSLILTDDDPSYPVKFIFAKKEVFKDSFNNNEDESYAPSLKYEKQIEIENVDWTLEELFRDFQDFFQTEPTRLNVLSGVFDLIADGKIAKPGYNITICDKKANLTDLILAVNYFLPISLANKVSFATYVDNPESTNYPFEITGIIPECGIDILPEKYFNFVDGAKFANYIAKQPYTKRLAEIISKGDYSVWKDFLKEVKDFEIDELNDKLNKPALFFEFKSNILNVNIDDVNRLLLSNLPLAKENQLKQFLLEKRSDLYLSFVTDQLEKTISRASNFNDKIEAYSKIYTEHFENNSKLRKELLSQFADFFRDKLPAEERSAANVYVLTNSNCLDTLPPDRLIERIQDADYWFENENIMFEDKLEAAYKLDSNYDLKNIENLIPNIMKAKLSDELIKDAKKGNLKKSVERYTNIIKGLKETEKQTLFILVFNNENIKKRFDYNDFSNYIKIIKTHLENESDFWFTFFRKNKNSNPNNDLSKHTLDYLLKKFIVYNFRKDFRPELFEKSLPLDDYSMKWIEEEIRESTSDNVLLEEFHKYFGDSVQTKKSLWNSVTNLIKKSTEIDNNYSYVDSINPIQILRDLDLDKGIKTALESHFERIKSTKRNVSGIKDLSLNVILRSIPKHLKVSIGLWINDIYKQEGFISNGKVNKVTRQDLVPSHTGDIANLLKPIFVNSKGNILYIDSAETLFNDPNDALGRDTFRHIMEQIDRNENDFYIIFSDLSTEMGKLLETYPRVKAKITVF